MPLPEPDWDALRETQNRMASQVQIPEHGKIQPEWLLALDIQYEADQAYVGIAYQQGLKGPIHSAGFVTRATIPYRSGFFAFREGPALVEAIFRWEKSRGLRASLILIDGHGIAHPRGLGLASWVGLQADRPAIGIAKRPMPGMHRDLPPERGAFVTLRRGDRETGCVLRTRDAVKPIYISPGHLISVANSRALTLALTQPYRLPEPIRHADQHARALARGELLPDTALSEVKLP